MLQPRQKIPEFFGLHLEPVVGLRHLLVHHLGHTRVQVCRLQLEVSLRLRAIALDPGAGLAGDGQHGSVFAQRMNEHHLHAFVARMHRRPVEQARTIAPAARVRQHRHAKLSAALQFGIDRKCQVRHGDQFKPAVVDAENFIALEIQAGDIAPDLLVVGRIAKAQVAVPGFKRQQVGRDALGMAQTDGADGHHG